MVYSYNSVKFVVPNWDLVTNGSHFVKCRTDIEIIESMCCSKHVVSSNKSIIS